MVGGGDARHLTKHVVHRAWWQGRRTNSLGSPRQIQHSTSSRNCSRASIICLVLLAIFRCFRPVPRSLLLRVLLPSCRAAVVKPRHRLHLTCWRHRPVLSDPLVVRSWKFEVGAKCRNLSVRVDSPDLPDNNKLRVRSAVCWTVCPPTYQH